MLHSLEMRVPFIDHYLVEFFWMLPDHLKIKGLSKKYILKKAAERLLPKDIIYRNKKGFSVPLTVWFRNELKSFIMDVFSSENIKALGYFNYDYIHQILNEHMSAQRNHDEKIFALLSFMIWYWKKFKQ
jgi:asparagine synthase (glutamine-hydrolysing)